MAGKNQYVVRHDRGWAVEGKGNSRARAVHLTQEAAIRRGTEIAQNQKSELLVHRRNGQIQEHNSYGNDPYPPKGQGVSY
jgi:hypothetical protein